MVGMADITPFLVQCFSFTLYMCIYLYSFFFFLEHLACTTLCVLGNTMHSANQSYSCNGCTAYTKRPTTQLCASTLHTKGLGLSTGNCKWCPYGKSCSLQPVNNCRNGNRSFKKMLAFHVEVIVIAYCIVELGRLKKEENRIFNWHWFAALKAEISPYSLQYVGFPFSR